ERRARVDLAAFPAVALAEGLERDQPVVEFLTADPERMLWRLVRAGDEAVDRHRDVQLQLAHRSSLCRHARRTAQRVRSHRASQELTKLATTRSTQSSASSCSRAMECSTSRWRDVELPAVAVVAGKLEEVVERALRGILRGWTWPAMAREIAWHALRATEADHTRLDGLTALVEARLAHAGVSTTVRVVPPTR